MYTTTWAQASKNSWISSCCSWVVGLRPHNGKDSEPRRYSPGTPFFAATKPTPGAWEVRTRRQRQRPRLDRDGGRRFEGLEWEPLPHPREGDVTVSRVFVGPREWVRGIASDQARCSCSPQTWSSERPWNPSQIRVGVTHVPVTVEVGDWLDQVALREFGLAEIVPVFLQVLAAVVRHGRGSINTAALSVDGGCVQGPVTPHLWVIIIVS
jgi:hypothetical protein